MKTAALLIPLLGLASLLVCIGAADARPQDAPVATAPPADARIGEAVSRGVEILLEMQENDAEWPYEGVYRVRRRIPIGYRIGGTSIAASALIRAPDYADDAERQSAVRRSVDFVALGIEHPSMSADDYDGGYDVRGWGYIYAATFLLELQAAELVPDELAADVDLALDFYLDGLARIEIPQAGGWNYARPPGRDNPGGPSPFMTASALQALFLARKQGREVDDAVVERGLDVLERARSDSGGIAYAGRGRTGRRGAVPGAVGRMSICESTLFLAGRSDRARIRGAIDAFIVHWDWLDKRRAKSGTHEAPYGIAPYYFYFAHYYVAQAVELLPEPERAEYRRRINDLLFAVRLDDGRWNDRVFPRSANYGTAMAIMALMMPETGAPARWE